MSYIYFVGGTIQGSSTMGRLIDLMDFKGSGYTAGAFIKANDAGNGFEFASGVVFGDIEFTDLTCGKCGEPFKEGDKLILVVVGVGDGKIRARPAHHNCIGG